MIDPPQPVCMEWATYVPLRRPSFKLHPTSGHARAAITNSDGPRKLYAWNGEEWRIIEEVKAGGTPSWRRSEIEKRNERKDLALTQRARAARGRYWTTLGDHERAAAEPSVQSLLAWVAVVAQR